MFLFWIRKHSSFRLIFLFIGFFAIDAWGQVQAVPQDVLITGLVERHSYEELTECKASGQVFAKRGAPEIVNNSDFIQMQKIFASAQELKGSEKALEYKLEIAKKLMQRFSNSESMMMNLVESLKKCATMIADVETMFQAKYAVTPYILSELVAEHSYSELSDCSIGFEYAETISKSKEKGGFDWVKAHFHRAAVIKAAAKGIDVSKLSPKTSSFVLTMQSSSNPNVELISQLKKCLSAHTVASGKALAAIKGSIK